MTIGNIYLEAGAAFCLDEKGQRLDNIAWKKVSGKTINVMASFPIANGSPESCEYNDLTAMPVAPDRKKLDSDAGAILQYLKLSGRFSAG